MVRRVVVVHERFAPFASHTLECRWHEDPASSIVHFAMNDAATPFSAQISLTPCL